MMGSSYCKTIAQHILNTPSITRLTRNTAEHNLRNSKGGDYSFTDGIWLDPCIFISMTKLFSTTCSVGFFVKSAYILSS